MRKMQSLIFFFFVCLSKTAFPLSITSQDIAVIGDRIWKNECGGKVEGLTHWNKGEEFGSFGIGHFIWYPEKNKGPFEETFPSLLLFLEEEGVILPDWLKKCVGCPWATLEEFQKKIESPEMISLRKFLFETKNLQALFIVKRIEKTLEKAIKTTAEEEGTFKTFSELAKDPKGLYALIDYSNFKGLGLSSTESYKGHKWGLLQVLEKISPASEDMTADFVKEAKDLLVERVNNAPPERGEEKWLRGWHNRIDTYLSSP